MPGKETAIEIWKAGVDAVKPERLIRQAFDDPTLTDTIRRARRIIVVGAGKAGAAMAQAFEELCGNDVARVEGVVNVPAETVRPLRAIHLHAARPAGNNQPTAAGVDGAHRILELVAGARPDDVCVCLLSGGGSALLPAPVDGVSLEDKQGVTRLLHASGATISEMNSVRKHLSAIKGGRLARSFSGRALFSLIISDVIGDPLDVIASGPTAADPTTFDDALAVLNRYQLLTRVPAPVRRHLERGSAGDVPETPKEMFPCVTNRVIGNNGMAVAAAAQRATEFGYHVINLGSFVEGETREVAAAVAGVARSIVADGIPNHPPVCLLLGGETTVALGDVHGLGGRNQEFVLAVTAKLGREEMKRCLVLSGGTDGEDGPTDAAGAIVDLEIWDNAMRCGLDALQYLNRHDAYHFFEACGGLLKTGLTQTNVMDVRLVLID